MSGYPGSAIVQNALELVRAADRGIERDPFGFSAPQSSTLRFDLRHDYIPLDTGFSLNEHGNMQARGYPVVEVLAAIGLTHARPRRADPRDKLSYHYGIVGRSPIDSGAPIYLPPALLRASLGATFTYPFPHRTFTMQLGWPGKEGQARCITSVTEDTTT